MNNGYKEHYLKGNTLASSNGLVYEHRLVAAKKLGRALRKGETVHHVDGNRANNHPGNIWVFRTNADHARYHQHGKYVSHDDGTVSAPVELTAARCEICGKIIVRGIRCGTHRRIVPPKITWPSGDELITMIYRTNLSEVARNLGVSGAAIKKRLKRQGMWRPLKTYTKRHHHVD